MFSAFCLYVSRIFTNIAYYFSLVDEYILNYLKFKEWFSLKGMRQEIKNVHWLTKKELARDAFVVLAFTVILGVYFYGADALIALILKTLGLS